MILDLDKDPDRCTERQRRKYRQDRQGLVQLAVGKASAAVFFDSRNSCYPTQKKKKNKKMIINYISAVCPLPTVPRLESLWLERVADRQTLPWPVDRHGCAALRRRARTTTSLVARNDRHHMVCTRFCSVSLPRCISAIRLRQRYKSSYLLLHAAQCILCPDRQRPNA